MNDPRERLVIALARHVGAGNGITAKALAQATQMDVRSVRRTVTDLRLEGMAICGHPASGYFVAATAEELETTCSFLRARAMSSLTIEARLRRLPLPDLIGQLHLAT